MFSLHKSTSDEQRGMNEGFSFFLVFESRFLFRKKGCFTRLPTIAGLITAEITDRGNREVHAVQLRRGQTPRRGVFFHEVGRAFLRSLFLFSFFFPVAEKSKPEIRIFGRGPRRKVTVEESRHTAGKVCRRRFLSNG